MLPSSIHRPLLRAAEGPARPPGAAKLSRILPICRSGASTSEGHAEYLPPRCRGKRLPLVKTSAQRSSLSLQRTAIRRAALRTHTNSHFKRGLIPCATAIAGQLMSWHDRPLCAGCMAPAPMWHPTCSTKKFSLGMWEFCAYEGGGRRRVAHRGLSTGYFKPAREEEYI